MPNVGVRIFSHVLKTTKSYRALAEIHLVVNVTCKYYSPGKILKTWAFCMRGARAKARVKAWMKARM